MKILVTGATGLVGSALLPRLRRQGHEVLSLTRRSDAGPGTVTWDPERGSFDASACAGCDAVVHLAGENVAGGRWTDARMERIRSSRVDGTRLLIEGLDRAGIRPRIWVGASAIGAYGDRGDEVLDEDSARGTGYLADVCRAWEAASDPVLAWGARRVLLRIGVVMDRREGALAKMLLPFRLGLGAGGVELDLQRNSIGDEGAAALARALGECLESAVRSLDLRSNAIGDAGLEALSAHVKAGTARLNFMPARWTVPGPVVPDWAVTDVDVTVGAVAEVAVTV